MRLIVSSSAVFYGDFLGHDSLQALFIGWVMLAQLGLFGQPDFPNQSTPSVSKKRAARRRPLDSVQKSPAYFDLAGAVLLASPALVDDLHPTTRSAAAKTSRYVNLMFMDIRPTGWLLNGLDLDRNAGGLSISCLQLCCRRNSRHPHLASTLEGTTGGGHATQASQMSYGFLALSRSLPMRPPTAAPAPAPSRVLLVSLPIAWPAKAPIPPPSNAPVPVSVAQPMNKLEAVRINSAIFFMLPFE